MDDKNTTDVNQLKDIIAQNLAAFRKNSGMTQQQLAEKINYSDKAVSKWERGDGLPDVLVLKQIADLYGITVNDLLTRHKRLPLTKMRLKTLVAKRWLVALVSVAAVWLLATLVTVIWLLVNKTAIPVAKYAYVIALPVTFVLLLIFSCLWSKLWVRCAMASLLMWSLCLLAFVFLNLTVANAWLVFLIGGAEQVAKTRRTNRRTKLIFAASRLTIPQTHKKLGVI